MAHHWLTFKKEMTSALVRPWPQLAYGWLCCCLAIMTNKWVMKCEDRQREQVRVDSSDWEENWWKMVIVVSRKDLREEKEKRLRASCPSQLRPLGGANAQIYTGKKNDSCMWIISAFQISKNSCSEYWLLLFNMIFFAQVSLRVKSVILTVSCSPTLPGGRQYGCPSQ